MTRYFLTLSAATLMCGAAFAQTADTATNKGAAQIGSNYGTSWSPAVGSTFFSDPDMTTMRTPEEITTGWSSLSQEDRDAVEAECARYTNDTGNAANGTVTADTTADVGASADAGAATTAAGLTGENVKTLCDMVASF